MKNVFEKEIFEEERALYGLKNAALKNCKFISQIGESPLKECRGINVEKCSFSMRYPLWHTEDFTLECCKTNSLTRAALWYSKRGKIYDCFIGGIKALRECEDIYLSGCKIRSKEFGWRCKNLEITDCDAVSEYFLFESSGIKVKNLKMQGKYSFQYINGGEIENCEFLTKDAFWHSENLSVKNSVLGGEYLGWYSENLTLENCTIIGTQPLCYCKNLRLINCRTKDCDLAFEKSDVTAEIIGDIVSIKNPESGVIKISGNFSLIDDGTQNVGCKIIKT